MQSWCKSGWFGIHVTNLLGGKNQNTSLPCLQSFFSRKGADINIYIKDDLGRTVPKNVLAPDLDYKEENTEVKWGWFWVTGSLLALQSGWVYLLLLCPPVWSGCVQNFGSINAAYSASPVCRVSSFSLLAYDSVQMLIKLSWSFNSLQQVICCTESQREVYYCQRQLGIATNRTLCCVSCSEILFYSSNSTCFIW